MKRSDVMKCPGQDTRYWKPGDIFEVDCPHCGKVVEFFKDEATRKCRNCKQTVVNPRMDFGCAAYCKYAADCLGELGPELLAKRNDLLKDRVALEVKRLVGRDFESIAHAVKVARFVEEIAREEKAELALVLCAAYLHLFDERRVDHSGEENEEEVRRVLEGLGAGQALVDSVLEILSGFRRGDPGDSLSGKVLSDAHRLALMDAEKGASPDGVTNAGRQGAFLTLAGRKLGSGFPGREQEKRHTVQKENQ
jgi:hypothetical protein